MLAILNIYLSPNTVTEFAYANLFVLTVSFFSRFYYSIQHWPKTIQAYSNLQTRLDRWFGFQKNPIPIAPYSSLKQLILYRSNIHLRWFTVWNSTNNHCCRSGCDRTMSMPSLGQVSNSFPIVVFVLGNRWCVACTCVPTNDINTVNCWRCSIVCYSENWIIKLFDYNFKPQSLHHPI